MNGDEQQAAGTRYGQLSAQISDVINLLQRQSQTIAKLAGQVTALTERVRQLEEHDRGTLVDLRGNRLRVGGN